MACITTEMIGAPLERLAGLAATASDGAINIFWQNSISYPDQIVSAMIRLFDFSDVFTDEPDEIRDVGSLDITGLVAGVQYIVWIRPEISGYYGAWQSLTIIATEGEITNLTEVIHNGEPVVHNGVQVLAPYNPLTEVDIPDPDNGVTYEGDQVTIDGETVTYGE